MKEKYVLVPDDGEAGAIAIRRDNLRGEIEVEITDSDSNQVEICLNQDEAKRVAEQLLVPVGSLKRMQR